MLTPENIEVLNGIILEQAKISPTILGARLGDIVKKEFPGENIKSNYGSVAKFVSAHFSSVLTHSGRHGVDNVYAFLPEVLQQVGSAVLTRNESDAQPLKEADVAKVSKPSSKQHVVSIEIETALLREAFIESIRVMTIEQLRQLPIPAGILLDAIRKTNRL